MKVKVDKLQLSVATGRSQGAVSDKTFGQIGLYATEGQLVIAASDRVLAIYNSIASDVYSEGFIFVPGRLFSDVVKELPEGPVLLEDTKSFLIVTAGNNQEFVMKIPRSDETEWKSPPDIDTGNYADIPASKLCYVIEQIQCCVAYESPRNYGSVGFFHRPSDDTLRLVGTDGYRLSYSELVCSLPKGFLEQGVCLSKRALNELHRMGSEGFESVRFSVSNDQTTIIAETPGYKIFIRLSAVKYPNYQGVFPSLEMTSVDISRSHFQSVAKRVLLASDKTRALQLCFSDSLLTLKSRTLGSSEGKESIPLSDYKKGEKQLAVNGKFLSDVFSTISSQGVTLNFHSEDDPIVLKPRTEPEYCQSMHILIPIREN